MVPKTSIEQFRAGLDSIITVKKSAKIRKEEIIRSKYIRIVTFLNFRYIDFLTIKLDIRNLKIEAMEKLKKERKGTILDYCVGKYNIWKIRAHYGA